MSKMTCTYLGGLRTEAVHLKSSTKLITDAPVDNNGKGESFSPTDLICSALGSCMLTIMGIRALELNIDLQAVALEIEKIMTKSPPRKIEEIKIRFVWNGKTFSDEIRDKLKQAALTCPVYLSLHPDVKKSITF